MTAQLITLTGTYQPEFFSRTRVSRANRARYSQYLKSDELMGGLWDFTKSLVKTVASPITSVAKGVGHTVMETGRGIQQGDIKKILLAPAKGVGHSFMSQSRDLQSHAEYYYRPSKMDWMKPVGTGMMVVAPFTGPASPFLVGGGAALTLTGAVATGYHDKKQAAKAATSQNQEILTQQADTKARTNYIWAGLAVAGVGAYFLLT